MPADLKIRWLLKDHQGNDRDYALFGMPLLLAVNKVYAKIRNLKYRYLPEGTLFPEEIDQYEPYAIREALNNCIAHQDYTLAGRINVIEGEESLTFTNLGSFVPGDVQRVVIEDAPEEHYRNRFLATAMFNLKMVDTAGGGIRKLFLFQKARFFPFNRRMQAERQNCQSRFRLAAKMGSCKIVLMEIYKSNLSFTRELPCLSTFPALINWHK